MDERPTDLNEGGAVGTLVMVEKLEECPRCGAEWGSQVEYDFQHCGICAYSACSIPAVPPPGRLERIVADLVRKLTNNKED